MNPTGLEKRVFKGVWRSNVTGKTPQQPQVAQVSGMIDRQQRPITKPPWLPLQIHLASWRATSPLSTVLCDWIKEVGRLADCFMQIGFCFSLTAGCVGDVRC